MQNAMTNKYYVLNYFLSARIGHFYTPPLIPGLLPVQDKQKVFKLWKTELLPLYLSGIVLLR